MLKIKSIDMKINVIKLIVVISFLLPDMLLGQDIKVRHRPSLKSDRILFSIYVVDSTGNESVGTDQIFSKVITGNDDVMEKRVIASISIGKCESNNQEYHHDDIWLCLDQGLEILFLYPFGTQYAYPFVDGISLFSFNRTNGYMGAVDLKGNTVLQPKYDYITYTDKYLNGIVQSLSERHVVVFECNMFNREGSKLEYTYQVFLDNNVPIYTTVHNEYSTLVSTDSFSKMINDIETDNDTRTYLLGIHEMLNMNFERALCYFGQVKDRPAFRMLINNICLCEKMLNAIAYNNF